MGLYIPNVAVIIVFWLEIFYWLPKVWLYGEGEGAACAGRGRNGALGVPTAQEAVSWILLEQID